MRHFEGFSNTVKLLVVKPILRKLIQALVGDCDQLTSTTTTESTTTNGEFIPDYQCTASHPCPEGYCCWWDEKMCVLEAAVGSCDIFTTALRR